MQQREDNDSDPDDMEQFHIEDNAGCDSENDDYLNVVPTNNKEANVYKEPISSPLVSHIPICQPRKKSNRRNLVEEKGVDIIEADEDSCSGRTILSTHGSLKRKSTSASNTRDSIDDNDTPTKK